MNEHTSHSQARMTSLEKTLHEYYVTKAPFQIPPKGKEWIVAYGPWITLVLLILMLPAILVILGVGATLGTYGAVAGLGFNGGILLWIATLALLAQVAVMAIAIPGLLKRQLSAWKLMFYAGLANFAYSAFWWLNYPGQVGNLLGAVIGLVISQYILFQIRALYK